MPERCRHATPAEVEAALVDLDLRPVRTQAANWPGDLTDLNEAGLYSWWVDEAGATDLSTGLGITIIAERIYAGQTGATRWPSGKVVSSTLLGRIGGNHLTGNVSSSTFRRTLAAILLKPLALAVSGPAHLDPASESDLSNWMRVHLEVAVHTFPGRDALADLESRVLAVLDPPLNLEARPVTPIRARLTELRDLLTRPADRVLASVPQEKPSTEAMAIASRASRQAAAHRSSFTSAEIAQLRQLAEELRRADPGRQKTIRGNMRRMGFYISDYLADQSGFTRSDLDDLITRGTIQIVD